MNKSSLTPYDHDRGSADLRYVYPVVSRRAGGVSIGINLNINNACNWRCIYCQVPNLVRGGAPQVDLSLLEEELRGFLQELLHGDFMQQRVPEGMRRLNDIALSGNGEPTSAAEFVCVIEIIGRIRHELACPSQVKTVLITNGSLLYRNEVQRGLDLMKTINGEVWFKLDRASPQGMVSINNTQTTLDKVRANLNIAIEHCPTWVQTCWFAVDGQPPSGQDVEDYLDFISDLKDPHRHFQGVLLYGLARPSLQAESARLSKLSEIELNNFADKIRSLDIPVKVVL